MLRGLALAAALGLAAVLALACSSGGSGDTPTPDDGAEGLTRSAEGGGVTVEATWLTEDTADGVTADLSAYPPDEFVLIDLKLDTHSGDLNEIDLEGDASLRQDGTTLEPETWLGLSDDSHHREGVIVFPRSLGEGEVELNVPTKEGNIALVWQAPGAD